MNKFDHRVEINEHRKVRLYITANLELITPGSLQDAIEKWEYIVEMLEKYPRVEGLFEGGHKTCALCMHYNAKRYDRCRGCPVKKKTGRRLCYGTPYMDIGTFSCHEHLLTDARKELAFLRSLEIENEDS